MERNDEAYNHGSKTVFHILSNVHTSSPHGFRSVHVCNTELKGEQRFELR